MKIKTDISKNFFACFDEARGFAVNKKKILKTKNAKVFTYMQGKCFNVVILLLVGCLFIVLSDINRNLFILSCLFCFIATIYFVEALINLWIVYQIRKKENFSNTIKIDKNGITDESYHGIKMIFSWDKISALIVGKHTITILTDTPVYFYFNISAKEEVLKAIDKYEKKEKIVD